MVCDSAAPAVFCYIFFTSRHTGGVDSAKLVATGMALPGDAATDDALTDDALTGIFGIDLDLGRGGRASAGEVRKLRTPLAEAAAGAEA